VELRRAGARKRRGEDAVKTLATRKLCGGTARCGAGFILGTSGGKVSPPKIPNSPPKNLQSIRMYEEIDR